MSKRILSHWQGILCLLHLRVLRIDWIGDHEAIIQVDSKIKGEKMAADLLASVGSDLKNDI